jgi:hypothetical protein
LATLISASEPPLPKGNAILSPEGRKRFFVVHGGLFSKDEITLEDIRTIDRVGKQPGQEGIMCESFCIPLSRKYVTFFVFAYGTKGEVLHIHHIQEKDNSLMAFLAVMD